MIVMVRPATLVLLAAMLLVGCMETPLGEDPAGSTITGTSDETRSVPLQPPLASCPTSNVSVWFEITAEGEIFDLAGGMCNGSQDSIWVGPATGGCGTGTWNFAVGGNSGDESWPLFPPPSGGGTCSLRAEIPPGNWSNWTLEWDGRIWNGTAFAPRPESATQIGLSVDWTPTRNDNRNHSYAHASAEIPVPANEEQGEAPS